MGEKFAPSMAGLFMAQWEEENVFKNTPGELAIYKRYIDDIFILWKGDRNQLVPFLENLNKNDRNTKLSWDISEKNILFLDLQIIQEEHKLMSKTHFKNVDRNSYLPLESCHHRNCLYNIPKGQLMRLRRNCTNKSDFLAQAENMGHRFIKKGYDNQFVKRKITEVAEMNRNEFIKDRKKQELPTDSTNYP